MSIRSKIIAWCGIMFGITLLSCSGEDNYMPKPTGYYRIDFPPKVYEQNDKKCGTSFERPTYTYVLEKKSSAADRCFQTLVFPYLKASLYLTYIQLDSNLFEHSEGYRNMAYEHRIKALAINEKQYADEEHKVYGTTFDIEGDVACNYIFYVTDSTDNFFAGSLYFDAAPNYDSLQPVVDFIEEDIHHMLQTVRWNVDSIQ